MGWKAWNLAARACDSCKAAPSAVFCRADSAFFCATCDTEIHSSAAASSGHGRVPLCDVCEQAPAAVTCKADAASLCHACDADIHSANPLASRHQRITVVPVYDAVSSEKSSASDELSEEDVEAASWLLLPDPNNKMGDEPGSPGYRPAEFLFGEMDPYLDLDLLPGKQKSSHAGGGNGEKQYFSDRVVPVQNKDEYGPGHYTGLVFDGYPAYDLDYPGSKPLIMYNFTSQSVNQSVSSSSMDIGVVPDDNVVADVSNAFSKNEGSAIPTRLSASDREARVLRYREKRKNRKFEKKIRYASRKAYAETRPRVKGRFAKRSEHGDDPHIASYDTSYGVVPTF